MKALVTGATGFIGSNVARALVEEGFEVKALLRRESRDLNIRDMGLELAYGDITDRPSVEMALEGCDSVFHVAALYAFWVRDVREMYRVNVEGTRNVLEAACRRGIRRVVYTSTVSTIKPPAPGQVANEEMYPQPRDLAGHYKRSKYQAEQAALDFCRRGMEVVVVNPTAPVGRGDVKPTPTGRLILDFLRGRMPAYVETGLNLVDVEDVASGHVLAFHRGRSGERYILGNRNMKLKEIFDTLAAITGTTAPRTRIPIALALGAAYVDNFLEGILLRREPFIPLEGVKIARKPMYVDCSRAVRELGLPQTPVEHALEKAARWFKDNGYV